jgi:hypothetical protein
MITPTVGRIVWFYERQGVKAEAAIIAAVHTDHLVNLTVFSKYGTVHGRLNVKLKQYDDTYDIVGKSEPWCEWMPYQKGQAAKTEQLEKMVVKGVPQ